MKMNDGTTRTEALNTAQSISEGIIEASPIDSRSTEWLEPIYHALESIAASLCDIAEALERKE